MDAAAARSRRHCRRHETSAGNSRRVGATVFLRPVAKVDEAARGGVIRCDLGSSMAVAGALWASMHGLVAALIARPSPYFPWEEAAALIRVRTSRLLDGLLARG